MIQPAKKDYKLAMNRHMDIGLLDDIIRALSQGEKLVHNIAEGDNRHRGSNALNRVTFTLQRLYRSFKIIRLHQNIRR